MAATSKLKKMHVSLVISSSSSSVETEQSIHEYTDDFHSEFQSSFENISGKLSEIFSDYSSIEVVNDDDNDEYTSQFVSKKLQVLRENQSRGTRKSADEFESRENVKELNPFWSKRLETLRQRNAITSDGSEKKMDICTLNSKPEDNCRNTFDDSKSVAKLSEIGPFQSAYERLKFENLREKYRRLIDSDVHSLEFCKRCQKLQDEVVKVEFCKNCVRKVREKNIEDKFSEHMSSRSSAILIANIIKDGPKPTWSSDDIWNKLLSGGYQQGESVNQDSLKVLE